jgi:glutaredoxin
MSQAILYTINGCYQCYRAKEHLIKRHIPFQEMNLLEHPRAIEALKSLVGDVRTPVFHMNETIWIGEEIHQLEKNIDTRMFNRREIDDK